MIGYVIGDNDMITGFRLVGVEGAQASTVDEAKEALHKALARSDIGIIILSEAFSADPCMREEVDKIRQERVTPMILELPGSSGPTNKVQLSDMISKILGIRI